MRFFSYTIMLIGMSLLISSCGSSAEVFEVRERARSFDPGAEPEIRSGGQQPQQLRLGDTEKLRSLDPLYMHNTASMRFIQFLYEGLTRLDEHGQPQPAIASEWTVSSDSLTYTFTLRDDVYFHDHRAFTTGRGRSVTAEDVEFAFTRMASLEVPPHAGDIFSDHIAGFDAFMVQERNTYFEEDVVYDNIRGIEVQDGHTITFTLNAPHAGFAELLASPFASVYPKDVFENPHEGLHASPVGTGPFIFSSASADTLIVLERNFNYYEPDRIAERITSLEFRYYDSETLLFSALSTGMVHMIPQIGPQTAKIVVDSTTTALVPGYSDNFVLTPTGRSQATLAYVEDNFMGVSRGDLRNVVQLLEIDAYQRELPYTVRYSLNEAWVEESDNEPTVSNNQNRQDFNIGTSTGHYLTYLAGLHASMLQEEELSPAIHILSHPNRDIHLYWNNEPKSSTHNRNQWVAQFEINHFALTSKSLNGILFNQHPWWISLEELNIQDDTPS